MLDERHLATAECSHDQRMTETAIQVQLGNEARQIMCAPRLLDQIDGCPLSRTAGKVDRHLGWQLVPVDEEIKQLARHQ